MRKTLGPKAEATLQFAVFANCYIMEIVFVVVLGDILVGTAPEFGGLLPEWTGRSPADCIWLRRDVILAAVSLLVLLPLAAMRSMEKLAVVNIIGGPLQNKCLGYPHVPVVFSDTCRNPIQTTPLPGGVDVCIAQLTWLKVSLL